MAIPQDNKDESGITIFQQFLRVINNPTLNEGFFNFPLIMRKQNSVDQATMERVPEYKLLQMNREMVEMD